MDLHMGTATLLWIGLETFRFHSKKDIYIVDMAKSHKQTRRKQRGGVLAKLPPADIGPMYYLGAHGFMTDRIVKVPDNTYIIFVAPSGQVCNPTGKDMRLFDSLILGKRYKTRDDFMEGWRATLTGEISSTPSGFPLFSPKNSTEELPSTIGIYEPGDSFHDLQLEFANDLGSRFIDMGLYSTPLAPNYLATCEKVWGYFDKRYPSGDIPIKDVGKLSKFYADADAIYTGRSDNMMKLPVRAVNLSTLLNSPEKVGLTWPDGKRLIIVNACRIPLDPDMPIGPARRLSVSQRKYNNKPEVKPNSTTTRKVNSSAGKISSGFKKGFLR